MYTSPYPNDLEGIFTPSAVKLVSTICLFINKFKRHV